jgi:phosphomethylpyrimidine synthase
MTDAQLPFVPAGRRKVYLSGEGLDVGVPFTEVTLGDAPGQPDGVDPEAVRLYDTSGPGSDPESGLSPLRRGWILGRGEVEEYDGRRLSVRDDGRAALRRFGPGSALVSDVTSSRGRGGWRC